MQQELNPEAVNKGLELAEKIVKSNAFAGKSSFSKRMGALIQNPESKNFLIRMMDVSFRSKNNSRISDYVLRLFNKSEGFNKVFNRLERTLVFLYRSVGHLLPAISIPAMQQQIRQVTSPVLFFTGDSKFRKHSNKRKEEGVVLNVNLIGEALLGEDEAELRVKSYCDLLAQKEVDYISIKLSTIYSQVNSLAHEYTVDRCTERLSILYDKVLEIHEETGKMKFVNLDMEEYRDLGITIDTFKKTLSIPRFQKLRMGIVLQAYLPDSYNALVDLTEWTKTRVANGGAPLKVRIVKGANLEMEKTEASLEDWSIAPFESKVESDANFKKMFLYMMEEEKVSALNIGIASHNIFDLSLAMSLVKDRNLGKYVDIEMLEGMANEVVDELLAEGASVLLYTPIVKEENYISAIAYLVRRLDEGTQDGNFLKEGYGLQHNTEEWHALKQAHMDSLDLLTTLNSDPKRTQDRTTEVITIQKDYHNVADTDWVLPANRQWVKDFKARWSNPTDALGDKIPVVAEVDDKTRSTTTIKAWSGTLPWQYELADEVDYRKVIEADSTWYTISASERSDMLRKAAVEMGKNRADLIAVAVSELGKTIKEVDVEVSEAIDFANFYAHSILQLEKEGIEIVPGGIQLVLSPWNFPVAIPIGGVLASLAAGKRVILKPSTNAAACGYLTCKCLWGAGIPKSAIAFMPAEESSLDAFLSEGNVFDAVILTGGTATAQFLLDRNPRLNLYAETGGKNSTIVTSLSDRDQAIGHVVQSAFGNNGQKCSATSLLILEKEVFEDKHFKTLLVDAAQSKIQGNPWNLETEISPLAVEMSDKLEQCVNNTKGEWLLKPQLKEGYMLTPGIKWGVTEADFEYNNELFGPILSVMKAIDLKDALRIANGVEYGLTSGIESLDQEEIEYWKENIQAGNLYINRSTTGAIVLRQPFGGMKASCFGYGMKAGGLNYVLQFARIKDTSDARGSFEKAWNNLFSKEIDYAHIRGQRNVNRYKKPESITLLVDDLVAKEDIQVVQESATLLKVNLTIYTTDTNLEIEDVSTQKVSDWTDLTAKLDHSTTLRALNYERLTDDFLKLCHQKAIHIYGRSANRNGRIELLNYLNEQNYSDSFHRYGNLMGEG